MTGDRIRRPIRVALLTPVLYPGGAERQMLQLAGALPAADFRIRFILLSERGPLADEAEAMGFRVDVLGLDRSRCRHLGPACLATTVRALVSYYRVTREVDIVDAWLVPAYTFAGLAQALARIPVLVAGRRSMADVKRSRSKIRELAAAISMRPFRAVVANSQAAADEAVALEGIPSDRMHVIRNAVVPVEVPAARLRSWRRDWGDDGGRILAGCIGSLRSGKGHDLLLDVAQDLSPDYPDLRFVFIGDGPLRDHLEMEIQRRGLTGIVKLHTHEQDARGCYGALDIVVQASESEGLPNAVLEAAASGKAIVATDVGGTREIIDPEVDGILVPRADRKRLGQAVAQLVADPRLRERLGRAASVKAGMFSTARLAEQTGALYLEMMERHLATR